MAKGCVIVIVILWVGCLKAHSQDDTAAVVYPDEILHAPADSNKVKAMLDYAEPFYRSEPEKALRIYRHAAELARKLRYWKGLGEAYQRTGSVYSHQGRYEQSIEYRHKAFDNFKKAGDLFGQAAELANIGIVYWRMSDHEQALEYSLDAASLFERAGDSARMSIVYGNIGGIFGEFGSYSSAESYLERSLHIAERIKDTSNIVMAYTLLSELMNMRDPKESTQASFYAKKGLNLLNTAEKPYPPHYLPRLHQSLAEAYLQLDSTEQAVGHFENAVYYAKKTKNPRTVSGALSGLATLHFKEGRFDLARQKATEALEISEGLIPEATAILYKILADIDARQGNFKNAYEHYLKYSHYQASTRNQEQQRIIHELETNYQVARKDQTIAENKLKLEQSAGLLRKKNTWIALIVSGIVVLGVIFGLSYRVLLHKQRLQRQTIRNQTLQAMIQGEEKERSRMAAELHDGIGGTISAIKMQLQLAQVKKHSSTDPASYKDILGLLDGLGKEIRRTAHNLMPDLLREQGLEEALKQYCDNLSNAKMQVHFQSYHWNSLLDETSGLLIYRMAQELLNNAAKHAGASEILVDLSQDEDTVYLTVEDNGRGFDPETVRDDGMGLRSIRHRVKVLSGKLEIQSAQDVGSTVSIELGLNALDSVEANRVA